MSFGNWHKKFDKIWPEHSKVSNIFDLIGSFWAKYLFFEIKMYRGSIFYDTEESCKIWRKTVLWFEKWHEKFGKFSPEHLTVSKLELWSDPFVQSIKGVTLKFFWGVMCHENEDYWKVWRGINLSFQNWHEDLHEFWLEHWKV